jgi:hypothetical protein
MEGKMFSYAPFKRLNRKAFVAFHRDGIIDILLGFTFFGFGLWLLLDNILFTYISWLSFGFYGYLKKTITIPRFGYVHFEEDKKQKYFLIGFGIVLLVLLLFVRFFLLDIESAKPFLSGFLRQNHVFIMSSIGAALLVIIGLWRGLFRFPCYGLLLFITLAIFYLKGIPGRNALFLMGILVFIIGLILLLTFIRQNPIIIDEVESAA